MKFAKGRWINPSSAIYSPAGCTKPPGFPMQTFMCTYQECPEVSAAIKEKTEWVEEREESENRIIYIYRNEN